MIKKPDVFRIDEKNKNSAWGWKYYKDYKDGTKPVRKLITQRKDGTPYKTKKEAEEAREAFIRAEHIRHGLGCNTEATLSDVYKTYSNTETWRSLALGTQRRYDSSWRVHISPELGDFKIASITAFQLREYLLQKYNNGVTFSNLENIYKVLSILFRYAANVGIIQLKVYKDMFKETTGLRIMPEKMRGEIKKPPITFSDIELYNMEKYLRDTNSPFLTVYMLARYAGLRRSECLGIRWSDVNFKNGTLISKFQMLYDDKEKINYLTPAKTHKGYAREIIMCPVLQMHLSELYKKQNEHKKSVGYQNTEKIVIRTVDEKTHKKIETYTIGGDFVNRRLNGELIIPGSLRRLADTLNKVLREEKRPFKLHNLRHDFATRCATNGVSSLKLCVMMGHEKYETTMKYYINSSNDELDNKTRKLFAEIFAPKEVNILENDVSVELNEALDKVPLSHPVPKDEISESASIIGSLYSEIEQQKKAKRVIRYDVISQTQDANTVQLVFEDGNEIIVDIPCDSEF